MRQDASFPRSKGFCRVRGVVVGLTSWAPGIDSRRMHLDQNAAVVERRALKFFRASWLSNFVLVHALMTAGLLHHQTLQAAMAEAKLPATFEPKAIDAFLEAEVKKKGRVGLSAAIVKEGKLVLVKGYGKRSLEESLPVETNTLFAIGSITKQFTCAAVLMLAEEGKLSV